MPTLREWTTKIGFATDQGQVTAVNASAAALKWRLETVAVAAEAARGTIASVVTPISGWIKGAIGLAAIKVGLIDYTASATKTLRTAEALGLTTGTLQTWGAAAAKVGIDADTMSAKIGKIGAAAAGAASGDSAAAKTFKDLGIEVKGADGKVADMETILDRTLQAFDRIPPGAERSRAAIKLFGKSGVELLPILGMGTEGMAKLRVELQKSGVIMSMTALRDAKRFKESMGLVKLQFTGFRNAIMAEVMEPLSRGIKAFTDWTRQGDNSARMLAALRLAMSSAAAVMVYMAGAAMVGKLRGLALAIKAVYASFWSVGGLAMSLPMVAGIMAAVGAFLILEDIITGIRGGDSVIFAMFSPEEQALARDAFFAMGLVLKELWGALKMLGGALVDALKPLASMLGFASVGKMIFAAFKLVLLAVTAIIFLVIKAIQGIVYVITVVVQGIAAAWEPIKEIFSAVADGIAEAVGTIIDWIKKAAKWLGKNIGTPILDALTTAFNAVAKAAEWAMKAVKSAYDVIANPVGRAYRWIKNKIFGSDEAVKGIGDLPQVGGEITSGGTTLVMPGSKAPAIGAGLTPIPGPPRAPPGPRLAVDGLTINVTAPTADPEALAQLTRQAVNDGLQQIIDQSMGDYAEVTG